MIKLLKNNVKCQGHLKVKVIMLHVCEHVCEYDVNLLTNEKVIRGKRNFNSNCYRRRMTTRHPLARQHVTIFIAVLL